jgi:hypothetical protein
LRSSSISGLFSFFIFLEINLFYITKRYTEESSVTKWGILCAYRNCFFYILNSLFLFFKMSQFISIGIYFFCKFQIYRSFAFLVFLNLVNLKYTVNLLTISWKLNRFSSIQWIIRNIDDQIDNIFVSFNFFSWLCWISTF